MGFATFCLSTYLYFQKTFGFISMSHWSNYQTSIIRFWKLSELAPALFQHSMQVSNLAAELLLKQKANPFSRTGAMYHDIGK